MSRVSINGGCNSFSGSYQAFENKTISFSDMLGTLKACQIDNDSLFISALKSSVTYQIIKSFQINLYDSSNKLIMQLTTPLIIPSVPQVPKLPPVQQSAPVKLQGKFSANLEQNSSIVIQFNTQNKVSILNGCNSQSGNYQAYANNTFSVTNFISTLKFCADSKDSLYLNALTNAVSFTQDSKTKQITLKNKNLVLVTLTPYVQKPQVILKPVTFNNTFKTNLNDDTDLLIRFQSTNRVSILNGCNVQSASYEATDNGVIKFGSFISTRIFCQNDKDSIYVNALTSSNKFTLKGEVLTLLNALNQQTLVLTPYVAPPIIESPSVPFSGIFSTNILDDGDIRLSFDTSKINLLNGCNNRVLNYKAYQNGTVTFSSIANTLITCQNDYDQVYVNALVNSISFSQNKDEIQFKNSKGQTTIILTKYVQSSLFLQGTYKTNIPNITNLRITFEGKKISINGGCNNYAGQYIIDSVNFSIGKLNSTGRKCQNDFDYLYLQALQNTKIYTNSQVRIIFQDINGKITTYLDRIYPNPNTQNQGNQNTINDIPKESPQLNLTGNYSTNIKDDADIVVNFNGNRVNLLNGCNTYGADYKAFANGTINFGSFIGTKISCNNDFDYIYLNALSDSISFTSTTSQVTLKGSDNQVNIILIVASQQVLTATNNESEVPVYYTFIANYKIFQGFRIINQNDPYLAQLMSFLSDDYSFFLRDNSILSAFKKYRDDVIDYQIVMKTLFGNFNAFLEYRPNNARKIMLKSLAIIDFNSLTASYDGCDVSDKVNKNCQSCSSGYRNFKGRCFKVNSNCSSYVADQCVKCKNGLIVEKDCQSS